MKTFSRYDLSDLVNERKVSIEQYISSLSDEDALSDQDDVIINNMYEKYKFIPVEIKEEIQENREIEKTTIQRYNTFYKMDRMYEPEYFYIDGVRVTYVFPYNGDKILFECRASTFSLSGTPNIDVFDNYIKISAEETLDKMNSLENKDLLSQIIQRKLDEVKRYVGYANNDIIKFNNCIKEYAKVELNKRKEKADKFYNISQMLEIPIVKSNPKIIDEIKFDRKIVPLIKKDKVNKEEYCISDEIYLSILEMIKHQGSTFERTPEVYNKLQEEDLRDIMLGHLNGLYRGKANGECFRRNGKTDISIEYENRAAFVAECKIWAGKKVFSSALAQLQSYITWRDNKLCLIIFSRNKDFFKVLNEIKETIPLEENYISYEEMDKNEFELKIKSKNNQNQILKIRVFAFDLNMEN